MFKGCGQIQNYKIQKIRNGLRLQSGACSNDVCLTFSEFGAEGVFAEVIIDIRKINGSSKPFCTADYAEKIKGHSTGGYCGAVLTRKEYGHDF